METLEQHMATQVGRTREQLIEEQKIDKEQFKKVIKAIGIKVPVK
jgi:hypothetical protein